MINQNERLITKEFLQSRSDYAHNSGFSTQKWILFCEEILKRNYECYLYEARYTVSKYITVCDANTGKKYKVRFSNHKPNKDKEIQGDCDFFVGVSNLTVTTWQEALQATLKYFKVKP